MRASHCEKPRAICDRVEPRNRHHRLSRMTEVGIAPVRGRQAPGRLQKLRIFPDRYLSCSHGKAIYPDAMNRSFHVLATLGPHGKPAARDMNLRRFSDQHATVL